MRIDYNLSFTLVRKRSLEFCRLFRIPEQLAKDQKCNKTTFEFPLWSFNTVKPRICKYQNEAMYWLTVENIWIVYFEEYLCFDLITKSWFGKCVKLHTASLQTIFSLFWDAKLSLFFLWKRTPHKLALNSHQNDYISTKSSFISSVDSNSIFEFRDSYVLYPKEGVGMFKKFCIKAFDLCDFGIIVNEQKHD